MFMKLDKPLISSPRSPSFCLMPSACAGAQGLWVDVRVPGLGHDLQRGNIAAPGHVEDFLKRQVAQRRR